MNKSVWCKKKFRIKGDNEDFVYECCQFNNLRSLPIIKGIFKKNGYGLRLKDHSREILGLNTKKYFPISKKNIHVYLTDWVILCPSGKIMVLPALNFHIFFEARKKEE